jgi:acyl-coenzyme A thioesterase PaaI-like protein
MNFVAPARGERMTAQARVLRPGRTVTACAADVFAEIEGRRALVATMLATIICVSAGREAIPA